MVEIFNNLNDINVLCRVIVPKCPSFPLTSKLQLIKIRDGNLTLRSKNTIKSIHTLYFSKTTVREKKKENKRKTCCSAGLYFLKEFVLLK